MMVCLSPTDTAPASPRADQLPVVPSVLTRRGCLQGLYRYHWLLSRRSRDVTIDRLSARIVVCWRAWPFVVIVRRCFREPPNYVRSTVVAQCIMSRLSLRMSLALSLQRSRAKKRREHESCVGLSNGGWRCWWRERGQPIRGGSTEQQRRQPGAPRMWPTLLCLSSCGEQVRQSSDGRWGYAGANAG